MLNGLVRAAGGTRITAGMRSVAAFFFDSATFQCLFTAVQALLAAIRLRI